MGRVYDAEILGQCIVVIPAVCPDPEITAYVATLLDKGFCQVVVVDVMRKTEERAVRLKRHLPIFSTVPRGKVRRWSPPMQMASTAWRMCVRWLRLR